MRIRQGRRLVADRRHRPGASGARRGVDVGGTKVRDINQIVGGAAAGGVQRVDLLLVPASENGAVRDVATDQRGGVDDPGRKRLSAGGCSRGETSDGVGHLSISSIIEAGGKGSNSVSPPASAESAVNSDRCSRASPVAMELDQPERTLLLQSLRRVCAAAGSAGLTPKEAVARITEQGLPGLHEGGERLIVQVARSFRASSLFVEERGRYFIMQQFSETSSTSADDSAADTETESDHSSASSEAIEAASLLQNLQRIEVGLEEKVVAKIAQAAKESSSASVPRCNRDDGKGWRCIRPAESGYSLCKYHRDQIRRAEARRRKARITKIREEIRASNPSPPKEAVHADIDESEDDELIDHKRGRGVKAKSLKSIL